MMFVMDFGWKVHRLSRYIGWKPGRKFHSRFRMDGSIICTRDTTPRTIGCFTSLFVSLFLFAKIWKIQKKNRKWKRQFFFGLLEHEKLMHVILVCRIYDYACMICFYFSWCSIYMSVCDKNLWYILCLHFHIHIFILSRLGRMYEFLE